MPSPYNNQLPVDTRNDFYGFDKQLETMESFIDESINGNSSNFIFLGERTTGKSSFLNITREYAQKKGYLVNEKPFLVGTSHGENYLKFYSSIFSHILKPLKLLTGNDLYDDFTTLIDTGKMPMKKVEGGGEEIDITALPFRLPTIYNAYVKKYEEANIDANVIIEDLEKIHELYVNWQKQDSNDSADKIENNKIAIFLDDFQNILGENTDQIFKSLALGENPIKHNKGSDIIAEHLKHITENLSSKFLFVIASYPRIMDQDSFPSQGYVLKRNFSQIEIDHFETVNETKKLIIGPLKTQLEENHPLRKDFAEKIEKNGTIETDPELNRLSRRVHDDSNGYIWDIKREMDLVFDYYEQSKKPRRREKAITDVFAKPELALELYRKIIDDIEESEYHKKVEKYEFEKKYHLKLLTTYDAFTLDEIVEYHQIEIALNNVMNFQREKNDLKSIDENIFSNRTLFFGPNISSLLPKQVKSKDLEESLNQFIKDGIINYNENNQTKYELFGELKDRRYTRNYLRILKIRTPISSSNNFEDAKFNMIDKHLRRRKFYFAPITPQRFFQSTVSVEEYVNIAKDLFQYFKSGDEVLTDPTKEERNLIEAVSTMNFLSSVGANDASDDIFNYTIEIYSCPDYTANNRQYIGKQSHIVIEISDIMSKWAEQQNIVYNKIELLEEIKIPESFNNIYRCNLVDSAKLPFYHLSSEAFLGTIKSLHMWRKGDLNAAYKTTVTELTALIDNIDNTDLSHTDYQRKLSELFNNAIYLSLCDPKNQNHKTLYRDYKNRIDNANFISLEARPSLLYYNILLLKFFNDDKFDPNVFKDFPLLDVDRSSLLTCLILTFKSMHRNDSYGDAELVVLETKYNLLTCVIYTVTNLIMNKKIDDDDIESRPIINNIKQFYKTINDIEDSIDKQNFLKVFKTAISKWSPDETSDKTLIKEIPDDMEETGGEKELLELPELPDLEEVSHEVEYKAHIPSSYLQLYDERKITQAYELASKNLEDLLKNPDLTNNDISDLMNNTMFLSLCQNNSNHYLSFFKKHGNKIESMIKTGVVITPSLFTYNCLCLFMLTESYFKPKLFLEEYQTREKSDARLLGGLILMCDGNIETKKIVEIPFISLDLAWVLTLFSLAKTGLFSNDESGYINIELTKVFNEYNNSDDPNPSCLDLLKDKYIHFKDIFLK